mgnify:CR=1 FL=1
MVPLSADEYIPICFLPFREIILLGLLGTVVIPVLSTLYIRLGGNLYFSNRESRRYVATEILLNPDAREASIFQQLSFYY